MLTGTDNAALLKLVADYEAALRKCNADKMMLVGDQQEN